MAGAARMSSAPSLASGRAATAVRPHRRACATNSGAAPPPMRALLRHSFMHSAPAVTTSRRAARATTSRLPVCVPVACNSGAAVVFSQTQLRGAKPPSPVSSLLGALRLPLALVIALVVGYSFPDYGQIAHSAGGVRLATSLVFLLTGFGLRRSDVTDAFTRVTPVLYGMLSTLVLSPLLGIPLLELSPYLPDTVPHEFMAGLAAMLCMPTTLSTGVILTQQVGGNTALALLLLLMTNVLGVFTLPYAIQAVFGVSGAAAIDPAPLVHALAHTMLAPLFLGIVIRAFIPGMWRLLDAARPVSRLLQQACLVATPWMSISVYADQLSAMHSSALLIAAAAAAGVHILLLAFNTIMASVLCLGGSLSRPSARVRRPVILSASQKTLPVCVAVLDQLGSTLGAPGLVILPCIAYHLLQILLGSALVAIWLKQDNAL